MKILFDERQIRRRLADVARTISQSRDPADFAVPVLSGGFVFAADLLRELASDGLSLPMEFIWLRSYRGRDVQSLEVISGPSSAVAGKHVLLIDGVLDHGTTLMRAKELLLGAGAATVTTVVALDKGRSDALLKADHALFCDVQGFIVGYGMDDAGNFRGLPYIAKVD